MDNAIKTKLENCLLVIESQRNFIEKLVSVLEGSSPGDYHAMSGLPMEQCQEVYDMVARYLKE